MNFNPFFSVFLGIFLFVWTCNSFFGPSKKDINLKNQSNITIVSQEAASDGLNLQLLPGLIKKSTDAVTFEKKLNQAQGVNNLDLNNDGKVDYLKVDEYGNKKKGEYGFSITTEVAEGEIQELATIEIKQEGDKVRVNTQGNQQIYGPRHGYSAFYGIGSFFMLSYLLSPHGFYTSPHYYRNYPQSYRSRPTVSRNDYLNRANRFEKTSSRYNGASSGRSPNANKSANSGIKKSLRQPTSSQKSFQSRLRNRKVGSGGFGRNSTTRSSRGFFGSGRSVRGSSGLSRGFGGFGK